MLLPRRAVDGLLVAAWTSLLGGPLPVGSLAGPTEVVLAHPRPHVVMASSTVVQDDVPLQPGEGPPGTLVTVVTKGLQKVELPCAVEVAGTPVKDAKCLWGVDGGLAASFAIPQDSEPQATFVVFRSLVPEPDAGQDVIATATFIVLSPTVDVPAPLPPPPSPPPPPPSPPLPKGEVGGQKIPDVTTPARTAQPPREVAVPGAEPLALDLPTPGLAAGVLSVLIVLTLLLTLGLRAARRRKVPAPPTPNAASAVVWATAHPDRHPLVRTTGAAPLILQLRVRVRSDDGNQYLGEGP